MYKVILSKKVRKEIEKLPSVKREELVEAIKGLTNNPRPYNCKKLSAKEYYRIKIRNYRVLYTIQENEEKVVTVYRVGHRKEVYRQLD